MSTCAKVYVIAREQLTRVLRGEARIRNLPRDAEVVAMTGVDGGFGLRVHSVSFPAMPTGAQLQTVVAVTEAIKS